MRDIETTAAANFKMLEKNPYPGRLIVAGLLPNNWYIQLYAVMGRSANSRNRILVVDGDTVRTAPYDARKMSDPALIIYNAMRTREGYHIVSNGDHTDTIWNSLDYPRGAFDAAILLQEYEPDFPNFTPRISSMTDGALTKFGVVSCGPGMTCERAVYTYPEIPSGFGYCVHTYSGDGNPLPCFSRKPFLLPLGGVTPRGIANFFWDALNPEFRVALAVKCIDLSTGAFDVQIK